LTAALLGSLAVAAIAILLVVGASYLSNARASRLPTPTATPGIYLMTEGALQMKMTAPSLQTPGGAEIARVKRIVQQARRAAARYRDLSAAVADGYLTAPDLLVETQGQHYFQPLYLQQASLGHFDPAHPPLLVYNQLDGKAVLSGLLFYMPAGSTPGQLAAIIPPSLASWHQHVNLCVSGGDDLLTGTAVLPIHDRATCGAQGGAFDDRTGWMVHLWLNQPFGKSLFAMDRPR
jgi:hypothetical protein